MLLREKTTVQKLTEQNDVAAWYMVYSELIGSYLFIKSHTGEHREIWIEKQKPEEIRTYMTEHFGKPVYEWDRGEFRAKVRISSDKTIMRNALTMSLFPLIVLLSLFMKPFGLILIVLLCPVLLFAEFISSSRMAAFDRDGFFIKSRMCKDDRGERIDISDIGYAEEFLAPRYGMGIRLGINRGIYVNALKVEILCSVAHIDRYAQFIWFCETGAGNNGIRIMQYGRK